MHAQNADDDVCPDTPEPVTPSPKTSHRATQGSDDASKPSSFRILKQPRSASFLTATGASRVQGVDDSGSSGSESEEEATPVPRKEPSASQRAHEERNKREHLEMSCIACESSPEKRPRRRRRSDSVVDETPPPK